MEGGWERPRNHARTLGERDGDDEPLADGNEDDNNEYGKDGNIPNDNNKYAIGVDGVGKTLDEGDDQRCPRMSVPCESAAKHALTLRASYIKSRKQDDTDETSNILLPSPVVRSFFIQCKMIISP